MIEYALAALLGFAGGALGGMLGVGGGVIFVPALAIVLGETQIHAEATSLVAIVGVAIVGAVLLIFVAAQLTRRTLARSADGARS